MEEEMHDDAIAIDAWTPLSRSRIGSVITLQAETLFEYVAKGALDGGAIACVGCLCFAIDYAI